MTPTANDRPAGTEVTEGPGSRSIVRIAVVDAASQLPIEDAVLSTGVGPVTAVIPAYFELPETSDAAFTVTITALGYWPLTTTIRRGVTEAVLTLHRRANYGLVFGHLYGPNGRPVAGTVVDAERPGRRSVADEQLGYRLPVPAGTWRFVATADGYEPAVTTIEVARGQRARVDFELVPTMVATRDKPNVTLSQEEQRIEVPETIRFELDSARLDESAYPLLNRVAEILRTHPELRLRIEGHTDDTGSPAHNRRLSQARAKNVMRYLLSLGVAADRLEARGYGNERPLCHEPTAACRRRNRRVEFRIVTTEGESASQELSSTATSSTGPPQEAPAPRPTTTPPSTATP